VIKHAHFLVKGTILRSHLATLDTSRNSLQDLQVISWNLLEKHPCFCPVTVRNETSRSQVISVIGGSSGIAAARCSVAGSAGLAVGVSSDEMNLLWTQWIFWDLGFKSSTYHP
jgi:hypothetical protein